MGFLFETCNQLRNKQSTITSLVEEENIENHFMKGKAARSSYVRLLQFALLLLKPYAKNYEAGNRFIERIHRSVEGEKDLEALMTEALQCEEGDMKHWAKEMQACGGNGALALDVLLLCQEMEVEEEGMEAVGNFFAFLDIPQELIEEVAEIAKHVKVYQLHGEQAGDAAADIGDIYREIGNHKAAFEWYKKSAEEGFDWGMYCVANCYRDGEGVKADQEQAAAWFKNAYELQGEAAGWAAYEIGEYYNRYGNRVEAFEWYRKGAKEGCDAAMMCVARSYRDGEGVQANQNQVVAWLKKAYGLHGGGAGVAACQIGMIYNDQGNSVKAFEWYRKSAEEGYDAAMMCVARSYRDGDGVQANQKQAVAWFKKVYELHGESAGEAANGIGLSYGAQGNYVKEFEWYKKSAEEGFDWGMHNLACCYRDGEGVEEDEEQAIALFQKAYELHGVAAADAAFKIGEIYNDQGDRVKSFEWYKKGAEKGHEMCMLALAVYYTRGYAIRQDYRKAREWCQRAIACHGEAEELARELLDILD